MKTVRAFRLGRSAPQGRFAGVVVRIDGRRRRMAARAMQAAGWPRWAIARALRIPRTALEAALAASPAELFWGARAARVLREAA